MKVDVLGTTFTDIVVKTDYLNMKFDDLVFSKHAKISAGGNGSNVAINLSKNNIHVDYHVFMLTTMDSLAMTTVDR